LENGLGETHEAEHIETHQVSEEASQDAAGSGLVVNDEWDAAWDSDEQEDGQKKEPTKFNDIDDGSDSKAHASSLSLQNAGDAGNKGSQETEDDGADDAWGWGDEDPIDPVEPIQEPEEPEVEPSKVDRHGSRSRAITMKETYR
jgi:hypothetical protein